MIKRYSISCRPSLRARLRRGLAPLELVLWLPLLLFTTALIVNFGTMAVWRVRGEVVARDAVWRARTPRTGSNEKRPVKNVWPKNARMDLKVDFPVTDLDVPEIDHPVVRGPLPNFDVLPTLDPDFAGALRGESEINRPYPLLPRLGGFESGDIRHPLVDRKWTVAEMGIATNRTRRMKSIYVLPRTPNHLPQAFVHAVEGLFDMLNYDALRVLEDDEEIQDFYGGIDFHYWRPVHRSGRRVNTRIYGMSREHVRESAVEQRRYENRGVTDYLKENGDIHLGGVSLLPRDMTTTFLAMYRAQVNELLVRLAEMQRELQELPGEIARLEQLLSELPGLLDRLRAQLNSNPPPSNKEAAALRELIAQVAAQLRELPSQIRQLRERLAELPDRIRQTQDKIDELDEKIEQLSAFKERIPDIEEELRARHLTGGA